MRLIDADVLDEEIANAQASLESNDDNRWERNKGYHKGLAWARRLVTGSPTIDAVPVPVPVVHGQWVKAHGMMPPEYHHRKQCSMCGGWALQDYFGRERLSHYCPNCGEKMDGGADV